MLVLAVDTADSSVDSEGGCISTDIPVGNPGSGDASTTRLLHTGEGSSIPLPAMGVVMGQRYRWDLSKRVFPLALVPEKPGHKPPVLARVWLHDGWEDIYFYR